MENKLDIPHSPVLLVFILCLFFISASVTRDFHSRGEAREAIVMQDMLSTGNLVLPQGYSGVIPSKPPLLHWMATFFALPVGQVSELSARLPSILAACLVALISFFLFSAESSKVIATLSAIILASSIEWLRTASAARVDMLLTAALMSSFFALYRWSSNSYARYPWLLMFSVALAILCKGPVGVVLPALVYLAVSLVDRATIYSILKRGCLVFGPAVAIAFCWYFAAYLNQPERFLEKIWYENVARFLSIQEDQPHKGSALKLYGTVVLGFMPWTLVAIALAIKKVKLNGLRAYRPSKQVLKDWFQTLPRLDLFSLLVVAITLIFYSIPEGKRSAYVLPVYPFISYWLARIFLKEAKTASSRLFIKAAIISAVISILLVLFLGTFLISPTAYVAEHLHLSINSTMLEAHAAMRGFFSSSYLALVSCSLSAVVLLALAGHIIFRGKKEAGLPWFIAMTLTLYFTLQLVVVPAAVNPISAKIFAKQIVSSVPKEVPLLSFGEEFYALSFYSGRKFLRSEQTGFPLGAVIIVADDDVNRLKEKILAPLSLELIGHSGGSVMSYGEHLGLYRIIG